MTEYRFAEIGVAHATRKPGETYTDFAERRLAELGLPLRGPISEKADVKKPKPQIEYPEDVIPDIDLPERTEAQREMDALIDRIDVLDAYDRWIGKNREDRNGRDHNIMVSCPMPTHTDSHPSASVSFRKNDDGVWACHKCQVGGDKYDLAAIRYFGRMEGYKNKDDFPELRRLIAEELGYRIVKSGKNEWLEQRAAPATTTPEEVGSQDAEPEVHSMASESAAVEVVTDLNESPQDSPTPLVDDDEPIHPTLDWRTIPCIRQGTFLHEWMEATSHGDEPEEFYLGLAFIMLGAAVASQVKLEDDPLVRANVMMSLVGSSGTGKSIAVGRMQYVLSEALPWSMQSHTGVKIVSGAGSGEDLVTQFDVREDDPNGGAPIVKPVNGLIDEDEMATLAARMKRPNATMRQYIMRMFDNALPVATSSRGHGRAVAEDHFMQLITTTQPEILKDIMSGNDAMSGYLNRWLYIFGNVKRRRAIREAGLVDVDQCIPLILKVRGWSAVVGGRVVKWNDPAAKAAWESFFHNEITKLQAVEGAWLLQRLDLMCKKICLLLAINDHSTTVLPEHVESMKVIIGWIVQAYAVVDSKIGAADKAGESEAIISKMMKSEPGRDWTVRELKQASRQLKKINQEASWALPASIKNLVSMGEILEIKAGRTTRYTWNDQEDTPMATVTPIKLQTR